MVDLKLVLLVQTNKYDYLWKYANSIIHFNKYDNLSLVVRQSKYSTIHIPAPEKVNVHLNKKASMYTTLVIFIHKNVDIKFSEQGAF